MENLKTIIYQIREARHITLRDMAVMLQLSAGHLSQIENGKKPVPKNFYEKMKIALDLNVIEDNDLRYALNNARPQFFDYDPEELKRQLVALSVQLSVYVEQALVDLINKTILKIEEIIEKIKTSCNNNEYNGKLNFE